MAPAPKCIFCFKPMELYVLEGAGGPWTAWRCEQHQSYRVLKGVPKEVERDEPSEEEIAAVSEGMRCDLAE